ncbi:MAG: hypothetical protein WBA92_17660, partial [Pseudorhodobacter sp.]
MSDPKPDLIGPVAPDDPKAPPAPQARMEASDRSAIYDHTPRFSLQPPESEPEPEAPLPPPPDLTDPDSPDFLAAKHAFNGMPDVAEPLHAPDAARPKPHRVPRRAKRHRWGTFWLVPTLIFLSLAGLFVGLALTGKPLRLPTWALVEAESRINTAVQDITGDGAGLSVGGAVFVVDEDWIPRLRLEDVRLLEPDGTTFLSLPE